MPVVAAAASEVKKKDDIKITMCVIVF